jgi:hypothetical protein
MFPTEAQDRLAESLRSQTPLAADDELVVRVDVIEGAVEAP